MEFLLDTNVVSEFRKAHNANENTRQWQSCYSASQLWLSVISLMEIKIGIVRAERKDYPFSQVLSKWYDDSLLPAYHGRILEVSLEVAEIRASFESQRTLPYSDALIAATAKLHDLTLVTRNIKDFQGLGIELANPWEGPLP